MNDDTTGLQEWPGTELLKSVVYSLHPVATTDNKLEIVASAPSSLGVPVEWTQAVQTSCTDSHLVVELGAGVVPTLCSPCPCAVVSDGQADVCAVLVSRGWRLAGGAWHDHDAWATLLGRASLVVGANLVYNDESVVALVRRAHSLLRAGGLFAYGQGDLVRTFNTTREWHLFLALATVYFDVHEVQPTTFLMRRRDNVDMDEEARVLAQHDEQDTRRVLDPAQLCAALGV